MMRAQHLESRLYWHFGNRIGARSSLKVDFRPVFVPRLRLFYYTDLMIFFYFEGGLRPEISLLRMKILTLIKAKSNIFSLIRAIL